MPKFIEIMDTTLRDGEQTQGVSFNGDEKLAIAMALLSEAKVDRIEIASAKVSEGEFESVKKICNWADKNGFLEKVELLSFVDFNSSVDWAKKANCRAINLLTKGSEKHCRIQLGKKPEEHFEDIKKTIEYAKKNDFIVNAYLEDWSNGMKDSRKYVFDLVKVLVDLKVDRILLPDTLGILSPQETFDFVKEVVEKFPSQWFDFHAHNDYGLATANTLAAVKAGAKGVHVTVNGLGERTGNAPLDEVVAVINDITDFKTRVVESKLSSLGKMVEGFSGKRIAENKPITGANVFTQTAGIHADGDLKGKLYENRLLPERFGRKREYALGKLSGKSSLEMNLQKMGVNLSKEQKALVLKKIVELGDKKEKVTAEDLPFIVADVLETPGSKKIEIKNFTCTSTIGKNPKADLELKAGGKVFNETATGNGGYDAFMKALKKICQKIGLKLPELVDYELRIPPGGKTDAIVEATITWQKNGSTFKTIGVDSDQLVAAIKSTEKMLNLVAK